MQIINMQQAEKELFSRMLRMQTRLHECEPFDCTSEEMVNAHLGLYKVAIKALLNAKYGKVATLDGEYDARVECFVMGFVEALEYVDTLTEYWE